MTNTPLTFDVTAALDGIRQVQDALRNVQGLVTQANTSGSNALGGIGTSATGANAPVQASIALVNTLRQSIGTLERARDEAFDVADITRYNREIAAARVAMEGLTTNTGRTVGKIEALNQRIQALGRARDEAFDEADITRYNRELQQTQRELQRLQTQGLPQVETAGTGAFNRIAAAAAALVTVGTFTALGKQAVDAAKDYETSTIAFEVLAGSASAAAKLQGELIDFVGKTPFELPDVQAATKSLLAFRFSAKDAVPELQRLGNIAAAVNIPITDLATIYGKNKLGGFIQAEDLRQLAERGIPVFESLAKQLGVNTDKVKEMGSANKITFDNLKVAFDELGGAGGRFYGLIDKQSQTLAGRLSNLSDDAREASRAFGEGFNESLKELAISASAFLKSLDKDTLKEFGRSVGNLVQGIVSFGKQIVTIGAGIAVYRALGAAIAFASAASKAAAFTNPYTAAAVAALTAIAVIYETIAAKSKLAAEAEAFVNETKRETIDLAKSEAAAVNSLFAIIRSETAIKEDKKKAVDAILAQYPQYLGDINTEKELLENLDKAQNSVIGGILKMAIARSKASAAQKLTDKRLELETKKLEQEGYVAKPTNLANPVLNVYNAYKNEDARRDLVATNETIEQTDQLLQGLGGTFESFEKSIFNTLRLVPTSIERLNKDLAAANKLVENATTEEAKFAAFERVKAIEGEIKKETAVALDGAKATAASKATLSKEQQSAADKAAKERLKIEQDLQKKIKKLQEQAADTERQAQIDKLEGMEKEIATVEFNAEKQLRTLEDMLVKKAVLSEREKELNSAVYTVIRADFEKAEAEKLAIRVKYMKESVKKLAELEIQFQKERSESAEKAAATQIKIENQKLDLKETEYDLIVQNAVSNFNNKKRTDKEIGQYEKDLAQAKLNFDLDIQQKRLEIQLKFNTQLSDLEKENIKVQLRLIEGQKVNVSGGKTKEGKPIAEKEKGEDVDFSAESLFSKLVGDEKQGKALADLSKMAIEQVNALADAYVDAAEKMVAAADKRVDSAQTALETEIELAKLGYANDVSLKQQELADAKQFQAQATEEQRKAANIQIALQSVQQGAALALTAANIMKNFGSSGIGIPIAIGLIAAMFAAFAGAKAKARQAASYEVGGDAYIDSNGVMRGNRHSDGGVGIEVEGGEAVIAGKKRVSIVNRKMTEKHLDLISAINFDDRHAMVRHLQGLTGGISVNHAIVHEMQQKQAETSINQYHFAANTQRMEALLQEQITMKKNQEQVTFSDGKKIIRKGNVTRVVNM